MKTVLERSLVSGMFILVGQAIATLAQVSGTPQFQGVLWTQVGAVLVGVGELIRRQRSDPVDAAEKPPAP